MNKKQFALLFISALAVWTVGSGLTPLLPVYALQLGATPALAGYSLAFAWLMVSIGGLAGGWLSDRTGRRKLWMILCCAASPVFLLGMAQTRSYVLFSVLTGLLWLMGGMAIGFSMVLVGLRARQEERGRLFGILSMNVALSSLIGGATFGPAADRWGYPAMVSFVGGLYIVPIILMLFFQDPRTPSLAREQTRMQPRRAGTMGLGSGFYLLLVAGFTASVSGFVANMARSLAMDRAGFSATAIASTAMAFGLVGLPLGPLAGWLSDRLGRKRLIMASFVVSFLGRCWLLMAMRLWHYWGSMALGSVGSVADPIKSAWVSDLAPRESLGQALMVVNVSGWVGGVLGYGLAGLAVEHLGLIWTFVASALALLVAIALLIPIREATIHNVAAQMEQKAARPV